MGVMDWIRPWRSSDGGLGGMVTSWPILDYLDDYVNGRTVDDLWREQPHLRTVVGFLVRNVGQLTLCAYKVAPDGTRKKITTGPLAYCLRNPNPDQTPFEFLSGIVGDRALYENAYVTTFAVEKEGMKTLEIRTIRPIWLQAAQGLGPYDVQLYHVKYPEAEATTVIPATNVIHFHGWNPVDERVGVSPVASLRATLTEQLSAMVFRNQLWERGGRVGSYLTRPADAPTWEEPERTKFKRSFSSAWSGDNGSKAGGVPLLEDGMELKRVGFAAREEQFVEASQLSLQTVAAAYYVNPTMVGLLENANYSNVREFRRMLYGETLGPTLEDIAQRLTARLLPLLDIPLDGRTIIAFDTDTRTAGTFEESAPVISQAVGGPWMTVNEGRARGGLPKIDGGDELNKPLNITKPGDHDPIPADDDDQPTDDEDDDTTEPGGPPPGDDDPDNELKPKDGD